MASFRKVHRSAHDLAQPAYAKDQRQYIDAIDVEEHVQGDNGESLALRCSLVLFSDLVLVVKRNGTNDNVRDLCQLDNIDSLVKAYRMSQMALAPNVLGTPRKKNKAMSFKGVALLTAVDFVDLAGLAFGLEMREDLNGSSDRWKGRTQRFYQAAGEADPTRLLIDKERWLEVLSDAKARLRDPPDAANAVGRKSTVEVAGDEVWTYWSLKDRRAWESLTLPQRVCSRALFDSC